MYSEPVSCVLNESRMKILIADTLHPSGIDRLRAEAHQVDVAPALKGDALADRLRESCPEILIVRSTRISAGALDASPSLELVVRAGAGVDTIDVEAASERGIFVANCPGQNAAAVAELTIGLILALDRRVPDNVSAARSGRWDKAAFSEAEGLMGRTLGLVGFGQIGRAVAERARAFGMRVVAWSRSLDDDEARRHGVERRTSPPDVAAEADIVSIHVAAAPETRHLADRAFFEAMHEGALFVNTARSEIVDEEALAWALDHRNVRAALDVIDDEPAAKTGALEHPLADHPGVYLTHHIGASTEQAQRAVALEAARVAGTYARTGHVESVVNLEAPSTATHVLPVRHRDRVGVLAGVLDEVRKAGWNVQEMENLIFSGSRAAFARIRFDEAAEDGIDDEVLRRIAAQPDVLAANLIRVTSAE